MRDRLNVLVTGVGGGGIGHELVKALRLANRYRILGADMSASCLGLFDVDEAYLIPPADSADYESVIHDLCKRKRVKALFPGSEPELKAIAKNRSALVEEGTLVMANSSQVIEQGLDKWDTMTYLTEHGFAVPHTRLLQAGDEIPKDFPLPAVVKPSTGGGGSNNTFLVQDGEEFVFACRYLLRQGKTALLQEYVGTPEEEFTVGVLNTLDGAFVGSIALRRNIITALSNRIKVPNRTGRDELSPILAVSSGISQGFFGDFPEIRLACEAISRAFHSHGPLNIQGRFTQGSWYTFEINPRFSGTSYMRALMGFNESDLLLRHHLLGEKIPSPVRYNFGEVVRGVREQVLDPFVKRERWARQPGDKGRET